jgi:hypothetical protein
MSDEQGGSAEVPGMPEPEPTMPAQDVAPDQTEPEPPPAMMTEPPKQSRTGLIVALIAVVVLVGAFVLAGPMLFSLVNKTSGSSTTTTVAPTRGKITVAIDFVKALLNGDTLAIKTFLRDDAQAAISEDQWTELAAQDSTAAITYTPTTWSGDTTAVISFTAPDTAGSESTGTLTFAYDETEPLTIVMSAVIGDTTEVDKVVLVQAGTGWRVVSISNGTQTTTFDAALIKSMVDTSTAAPSATTTP